MCLCTVHLLCTGYRPCERDSLKSRRRGSTTKEFTWRENLQARALLQLISPSLLACWIIQLMSCRKRPMEIQTQSKFLKTWPLKSSKTGWWITDLVLVSQAKSYKSEKPTIAWDLFSKVAKVLTKVTEIGIPKSLSDLLRWQDRDQTRFNDQL